MRHFTIAMMSVLAMMWLVLGNVRSMGQTASGGNAAAKAIKNPVPATPESIAAGKTIFQKSCSVCHGTGGQGDGSIVKTLKPEAVKPANLTDAKWDHGSTDGEIFVTIRDGIGAPTGMMKPQKEKLKETDIWNLVNYVRSLGPKGK